MIKKIGLASLVAAVVVASVQARDQIRIVGSSTVYPFTSYTAEEFGAVTGNPTPVVESTGTGGGMKIFCSGAGLDTPDFTNASRAMKESEYDICKSNGVTNIIGMKVGFDGIAIAQSKENPKMNLTLEQIFLALAAEVPSKDGKSLVANPYKTWNEIDPSLPKRAIKMIGAPSTSGTRDSFDEMVMQHVAKKNKLYPKKYKNIRTDGAFIPGGENDNLIVAKLAQDKDAMGYFGYSFLEENHDKIQGVSLGGIEPTADTIANGKYPVSRSMFIYMKGEHIGQVKGMEEFIELYSSSQMIGPKGVLKSIGLIPMPKEELEKTQKVVKEKKKLTPEMVKERRVF